MNPGLRIAILGCGNMGAALARGLAGLPGGPILSAYDICADKVSRLAGETGVMSVNSPEEAARNADIIFLCVKPKHILALAGQIAPALNSDKAVISIAAGVQADDIRAAIAHASPVVRTMPTTTLLVQEGLFAVVFDDPDLPEQAKTDINELLSALGKVYLLDSEAEISAFTAVAGSGPGFMFQLWMGYVEGAVALGFPREKAVDMVLSVALGSAKLALETGQPLSELYSMVASPAGTTVAGALHLERHAVRGHIADAVIAAFDRSEALGRKAKSQD